MVTVKKNVRFDEQVAIFQECVVEKDPTYFSAMPTVELTAFNNVSDHISGSNDNCCSRWVMSNNDLNDIPPNLPLRQNKEPANTFARKAISIVDQPQDALPPSNVDYKKMFLGLDTKYGDTK
jgi:hypothetical protein